METILSTAIVCVAIMCWLFGTFYFYGFLFEENDDHFDKISKSILAAFIGWIATPIILGIENSEAYLK